MNGQGTDRTAPEKALVEHIAGLAARAGGRRIIVAVAGPPGAGKSTLAERLAKDLGDPARVVPMDGFHFDNRVLEARGLLARKGAPETFDVDGFLHLLHRLRADDGPVAIPLFDRPADLARAGADIVAPEHRILVVEGNYLLLDRAPWDKVPSLCDLTVALRPPEPVLRERLVARWLHHGLSPQAAEARAEGNDLPNARLVLSLALPADVELDQAEE